jgi:hypothetical protein
MSLQLRFGIAGAALGLVIGITGSLVAGVPIGILILRALIAAVVVGVLGLVLHAVVNAFLPELLSESAAGGDDGIEPGQSVNITLPEEGFPEDHHAAALRDASGADQAAPLRQAVVSHYSDDSGADGAEDPDGIIEEVSEDRRSRPIGADATEYAGFNEAAFYDGVDRLPDIGGFSEQFQPGEASQEASDDAPDIASARAPSGGSSKRSGQTNMDPSLIAQAIRTALKKDDR